MPYTHRQQEKTGLSVLHDQTSVKSLYHWLGYVISGGQSTNLRSWVHQY